MTVADWARVVAVLEGHDDRGPEGGGWQSDELWAVIAKLREYVAGLETAPREAA